MTFAARWRVAAVVALGLGAGAGDWLADRRLPGTGERPSTGEIEVTSGEDAGRGSLREALFAAAAADRPVRVVVRARVELETPLPPVIHTGGLEIEGRGLGRIDAGGISGTPALDLASPGTRVLGLRVQDAEQGFRVGGSGVELRGVGAAGCDEGVHVAAGAHGFLLAGATLEANRLGVVLSADLWRTRLDDNRFRDHGEAAVRAVAAAPAPGRGSGDLEITGNRFSGDHVSIVLANVAALVDDNDVDEAREAAIQLIGAGAEVRGNRIRGGARLGIHAHDTRDAVIAGNEIDGNGTVGIMVHAGLGIRIADNWARENGYGVATFLAPSGVVVEGNLVEAQRYDGLFVVGGAPRIVRNRVLANRGAGLRVLDYLPATGPRVAARPRLEGNVLEGNRLGPRLASVYRERR